MNIFSLIVIIIFIIIISYSTGILAYWIIYDIAIWQDDNSLKGKLIPIIISIIEITIITLIYYKDIMELF